MKAVLGAAVFAVLSVLVGVVGAALGLPGPWWYAAGIVAGIMVRGFLLEVG